MGSGSAQGAESHFMEWIMRRIVACAEDPTAFECAIGRSLLVSADQAHACHPNYGQKQEVSEMDYNSIHCEFARIAINQHSMPAWW